MRREVDYEDIKTTLTFTACSEKEGQGERQAGRTGGREKTRRKGET